MQLRVHPKMKWHGTSSWPPAWGGSYGRGSTLPLGEEGVLLDARFQDAYGGFPKHLVLTIEYNKNKYNGPLCADDPNFLTQLYPKLRECLGQPIQQIGNMEIDLS